MRRHALVWCILGVACLIGVLATLDRQRQVGRPYAGFWVMENLTVLRNGPDAVAAKAAGKDFLYTPPLTPRGSGAINIRYELASAGDTVSFELVDKAMKVVKRFASTDTVPTPPAPVSCFGQPAGGGGGGGRGGAPPAPPKVTTNTGTTSERREVMSEPPSSAVARIGLASPPVPAVDAPRMHHAWLPDRLQAEQRNAAEISQAPRNLFPSLRALGHSIDAVQRQGDAHTIYVTPAGEQLGVADKRRSGAAAGV